VNRSWEYPSHGGNLRWAAETFGREPGDFLDFSSSLNPLGPPPLVREFLEELARGSRASWRSLTGYPDPEAKEARRALAGFLGVPEEAVLLTSGGTEAIRLVVLLWREASGERGATPYLVTWAPAFGEYERAARALRMPVIRVFMDPEKVLVAGWAGGKGSQVEGPGLRRRARLRVEGRDSPRFCFPSPLTLSPLARPGTLFFLCQPHSPTGAWVDPEEILRFHASLPPGAGLVVDEAFLWLAERAWPGRGGKVGFRTLAREAAEREGLFVVGSLTKAFALPGLRVGYAVARPEEMRRMGDFQPTWSANGLAQALVPLCLREAEGGYIARTLELLSGEKRRIEEAFSRDPVLASAFRLFPSEANFYLARELSGDPVRRPEPLFAALGRRGVLVRDLSSVPGLEGGYFRFAVRTEEENIVLLRVLKEVKRSRA